MKDDKENRPGREARLLKRLFSRKVWRKITSVMLAVVVFFTTYMMILPAISIDLDTAYEEPGMETAEAVSPAERGTIGDETLQNEYLNDFTGSADALPISVSEDNSVYTAEYEYGSDTIEAESIIDSGDIHTDLATGENEFDDSLNISDLWNEDEIGLGTSVEVLPDDIEEELIEENLIADFLQEEITSELTEETSSEELQLPEEYAEDQSGEYEQSESELNEETTLLPDLSASDEVKNVLELKAEGLDYRVTVTCTENAGITEDVELQVNEILPEENSDTDTAYVYGISYEEYVAYTENVLGIEEGSAGYIRLFDIKIVDQDDHSVKYQPAVGTSVDVTIKLADMENDINASVVRFGDNKEVVQLNNTVEGDTVSFVADSFGVFAVTAFDDIIKNTPYMNIRVHSTVPMFKALRNLQQPLFDGIDVLEAYRVIPRVNGVTVTLTITELPETTYDKVMEIYIIKDGEISSLGEAKIGDVFSFKAVEADGFALGKRRYDNSELIADYGIKLTGNFPDGAYAVATETEPIEIDGIHPEFSFAYDIKIYDKDGREWQPAAGEAVECIVPYEETKEEPENYYWVVLHTSEGVTEYLTDAYPVDGDIHFTTTSFSSFTVQARITGTSYYGRPTIVHFVDHLGNEIGGMTSGSVSYNYREYYDLYQYADDLNPDIADEYEFSRVYVQLSGMQKDIRYLYLGTATDIGETGSTTYRVYMFMNSLDECRSGGTYNGTWYTGTGNSATNDVYIVFNHVDDVSFKKVDSEGEPLAGAGFTLYTDSSCVNVFAYNGAAVTAESDEGGNVSFGRIPYGTYYMKETTTPSGIKDNGTVFTINVDGNTTIADVVNEDDDGSVIVKETGTMNITKEWSDGEVHSDDSVTIKIYDAGTEAGSVTLNAGNNWRGSVTGLDPTVSYMVSETNVTSSGEDVTNGWIPAISTGTTGTSTGYYQTDVFQQGEQYVIVFSGNTALRNSGNSLSTASVTVQNNMLTSAVNNNMLWKVAAVSDDGVISLQNVYNGRYLNLNYPSNNSRRSWGFTTSAPQFVRYSAKNGTVQIYYRENMNEAVAYYLNGTSYSTSSGTNFTLYKKVNVRTVNVTVTNRPAEYPLMIRKLEYSSDTAIAGTTFSLYTEEEYNNGNLGTPVFTGLTSGTDGYLTADGTTHIRLLAGSYYLVETQAAGNYVELSKPVHFSISRGGRFTARNADQEFTDYTYASAVSDVGTAYPLLKVPNQKKITLTFKAEDGVDKVSFESGSYISMSGNNTKELTVVIPEVSGSSVRVKGIAEDGNVINGWTINDKTAKLTTEDTVGTTISDDDAAADLWTDRTYHVWSETEKKVSVSKEVNVLGTVGIDEIDTTVYFVVWDHGANRNVLDENGSILIKSIEIVDGEPQGTVTFDGLTSGTYSVWEVDADGRDLAAGTIVIGTDIAVSRIATRHGSTGGNRVTLTDSLTEDEITVINTYNHQSDVVDWEISKEWYTTGNSMQSGQANLNIPENASSTLALFRKDDSDTPLQTIVLDGTPDENGETEAWKANFTEIPIKDSEGNTLEYIVKEIAYTPETTSEGLYITAYTEQTDHDGGAIRNAVLYGTLNIYKSFGIDSATDLSEVIGNLQIVVTGPHGYNQTFTTLTGSGNNYSLTIPDLPEGTYHVKEVNYENLITGRKWNSTGSYIMASIMLAEQSTRQGQNRSGETETDVLVGTWSQSDNNTVAADVRIRNDYSKYDIQATKVWTDAGSADSHDDVTFTLYRKDDHGNRTKVGESRTIPGNAEGEELTVVWEQQEQDDDYILEEDPVYGYDTQVTGNALTGFTVTNTPKQENTLTIVKKTEGTESAYSKTYKVKVASVDFPEHEQILELNPVNGQDSVQVVLPYGTYVVEELVSDAADTSYSIEIDDYDRTTRIGIGSSAGDEGTTKMVTLQEESAVVTITNSYKSQATDVAFRKLDGDDHDIALEAVFQIEFSTDNDHYGTINNGQITGVTDSLFTVGETGTALALPDGYYRLTERTEPDGYHKMNGTLVFSVNQSVITLLDPDACSDYAEEIKEGSDENVTGTRKTIGLNLYNYKNHPISIFKTDVNGQVISSGAQFALYKASNYDDENQEPIEENRMIAGGTTGTDGLLLLGELELGEYRLVETKAPDGYLSMEHAMKLFVRIDGISAMQETGMSDIAYEGDEAWVSGQDEDTVQVRVWNNPGVILPSTGGRGITIFYMIGLLLMSFAGTGIVMKRCRRRKAF